MDLAGFEPVAFTFCGPWAPPFESGVTTVPFCSGLIRSSSYIKLQNQKNDGLGGIRTRGLYVANVTIYP